MVHAARSFAASAARHACGPTLVGLATSMMLAGCPNSTPTPTSTSAPPSPAAESSPPADAKSSDPAASPASEPAPSTDPSRPPENARAPIKALWRGIEGVDGGDADAMAKEMVEPARWFPPGGASDSVGGEAELRRAMAPWSSPDVELDLRRIIDPGGSQFIAQLSVAAAQGQRRYEVALVVRSKDGRIQTVRHYGDPLGPVRLGPAAVDPLDLGPVGSVPFESGPPNAEDIATARTLIEAFDRRDDEAALALLDPAVVLHDIRARKSRRGPKDFATAYRADLGTKGHLTIAHHYAGTQYVVLEGSLRDHEADEPGQEHGVLDVLRLKNGKIAETWHYLNRRARVGPSESISIPARRHPVGGGRQGHQKPAAPGK